MMRRRTLGFAFLFQFFTSLIGNALFKSKVIFSSDIAMTIASLRKDAFSFRMYVLFSIGTALGVAYLGYALFRHLRSVNRALSVIGFVFYALEGLALLVGLSYAIRLDAFATQDRETGLSPDAGVAFLQGIELWGNSLHMLSFCLGACAYYYCLARSSLVPKALSLWGLACAPILLIFTVLSLAGVRVPFILYLPYVPFELAIGIALAFPVRPRDGFSRRRHWVFPSCKIY